MLALLSSSIPLITTFTATCIAVNSEGTTFKEPSAEQVKDADSVHMMAFSSHGDLLLAESEGEFGIETWEKVHDEAKIHCQGLRNFKSTDEDVDMEIQPISSLEDELRDILQAKVAREQKWKASLG